MPANAPAHPEPETPSNTELFAAWFALTPSQKKVALRLIEETFGVRLRPAPMGDQGHEDAATPAT